MTTPSDPAWATSEDLARKLYELTGFPEDLLDTAPEDAYVADEFLRDADAIVTHIEVNDKHGVGVLIGRLFRHHRNIISIRSQDHYGGEQDFAGMCLRIGHQDTSRDAVFKNVLDALAGNTIARVLCVPYYPDDARNALVLKEAHGVPLCTYLMDDQNICVDGIPDELMRELLAKSSLRLAISPELAVSYELKYGCKFWFMPPVATAAHILSELRPWEAARSERRAGVMVGNIWGQRWMDLLRETVRGAGITLRWYSNSYFRFLSGDRDELARDSIIVPEGPPLPDLELIEVLRQAPFVVVPSGTLDASDDRRFIAQLSLPSRIPFIMATSHTPIIVLGDRRTGAGRFVEDLEIGMVCPYDRESFQAAVDKITQPDVNLAMRGNALARAKRYSDEGVAEWIWQSLARGGPLDQRYEEMMPKQKPDLEQLVRSGRQL